MSQPATAQTLRLVRTVPPTARVDDSNGCYGGQPHKFERKPQLDGSTRLRCTDCDEPPLHIRS